MVIIGTDLELQTWALAATLPVTHFFFILLFDELTDIRKIVLGVIYHNFLFQCSPFIFFVSN